MHMPTKRDPHAQTQIIFSESRVQASPGDTSQLDLLS